MSILVAVWREDFLGQIPEKIVTREFSTRKEVNLFIQKQMRPKFKYKIIHNWGSLNPKEE